MGWNHEAKELKDISCLFLAIERFYTISFRTESIYFKEKKPNSHISI